MSGDKFLGGWTSKSIVALLLQSTPVRCDFLVLVGAVSVVISSRILDTSFFGAVRVDGLQKRSTYDSLPRLHRHERVVMREVHEK